MGKKTALNEGVILLGYVGSRLVGLPSVFVGEGVGSKVCYEENLKE